MIWAEFIGFIGLLMMGAGVTYFLGFNDGVKAHEQKAHDVLMEAQKQLNSVSDALQARERASRN